MSFFSTINKIREGNLTGAAIDIGSLAASFIPGVGPAASIALQGAAGAGNAAVSGGSTGDIIKGGTLSAVSAGASQALGSLLSKSGDDITPTNTGNTSKAPVPNTATATTINNVKLGKAPELRAPAKIDVIANPINAPELRPKAEINTTRVATTSGLSKLATNIKSKATGSNVKKAAGQIGLQGVLSIASTIQGVKQAREANNMSVQSLLFQKQTYAEQKAETEKTKAQLKADAETAYNSANIFGENLYNSGIGNTLLTSNSSNGNEGIYSILNTGITARKSSNT